MNMITRELFFVGMLALFGACDSRTHNTFESTNDEPYNDRTDLSELGLKGKIKVIRQEEFYSSGDGSILGVKTGSNSFSFKFNNGGMKIGEQFYDSVGMIKMKSEYSFSEDGRKKEKRITDLDGNILNSYEYEYNEQGQLSKINITDYEDNEEYRYYSTYSYDENGNQISFITWSPDDEKFVSAENKYQDNKKVKEILYDNMDSPYAIANYEYNEKGDVIKEYYYSGNNILWDEYSISYTYDSQDNWIKKVYNLDKIHVKSSLNKKEGVQTITMRTLTYY
jgi:hypothetical protein